MGWIGERKFAQVDYKDIPKSKIRELPAVGSKVRYTSIGSENKTKVGIVLFVNQNKTHVLVHNGIYQEGFNWWHDWSYV